MYTNIEEAKRALIEKPIFSTSSERFLILNEIKSTYNNLPQPLRFSRSLSELLSRVSVPLKDYDLILGRAVDRELTEEEEREFSAFIKHPDHPAHSFFLASGHCTYSWEMLIENGISALRNLAKEKLDKETNEEKRVFLSAMVEGYDAIISYMLRYADEAEAKGLGESAANLRRAATEPPSSFASALQLLWIVTLIDCAYISENPTLTLGRLDKILYPLYKNDIESGVLTRNRAREYITDYYCKHNLIMGRGEHQVGDATNSTTFKRILNFDAPQYLLLAGTDECGEPVFNELTELFAECIVPEFKNPVVIVRYVKGMDESAPKLWKTLSDRAYKSSSIIFYNDKNVLNALQRIGLPPSDAVRYAHFGCNWCSPGDNSAWMNQPPKSRNFDTFVSDEERRALEVPYMRTRSEHAWPEDFVEILGELSGRDAGSVTIEDFYECFFSRMSEFIDRKLAFLSHELSVRKRAPSKIITFGDLFLEGSLNNAECFSAGAKYHFELQSFQMFGTVANCFISVDQLVMIEKKISLKRLYDAVKADFKGYPDVLALCVKADKYGMDTELSAKHTERLSKTASDLVIEKNRPYFERERLFLVPCMQSDTWHLKYGEGFGATPDGRRANTPFSQNLGPSHGAAVNGVTAMLNDITRLPSDGLVSGALNLDLDKRQFSGRDGEKLFSVLLATYLNQGGLCAQVTVVSAEELKDARVNPNLHRDLRVRVTGYSGIFVDICPRLQDDIINRLEN